MKMESGSSQVAGPWRSPKALTEVMDSAEPEERAPSLMSVQEKVDRQKVGHRRWPIETEMPFIPLVPSKPHAGSRRCLIIATSSAYSQFCIVVPSESSAWRSQGLSRTVRRP